jgi:hypothetical protein
VLAAREEAEQLEAEAEFLGRWAGERSAGDELRPGLRPGLRPLRRGVVLCGMSTKLGNPRLQRVLLGFGIVVFLATVAWVATFPISFSV